MSLPKLLIAERDVNYSPTESPLAARRVPDHAWPPAQDGTCDEHGECVRMELIDPSRLTMRPVLVVEDHADTRHMVQEYLQFQGIPTVGATNGLEGLAALREQRPSLVLLDLCMPVMDGWRFRQEQQCLAEETLARVPVVILSALADCEDHARRVGAIGVIRKPIDLDKLSALVRRVFACGSEGFATS